MLLNIIDNHVLGLCALLLVVFS